VLRNPAGSGAWRLIPDTEHADDPAARAAAQLVLDTQSEDRFVQDPEECRSDPAYKDIHGNLYNRDGERIASPPKDLSSWLTEELVPVRCPHAVTACKMATLIRMVKSEHDSIGGSTACVVTNVPVGLGEPCFDKLEATLAHAMLSLPATKGFEIGSGFGGCRLRGSAHNDMFTADETKGTPFLKTKTNHAGGTLGGITHGADITFRVAVKPVSTIGRAQDTSDFEGKDTVLEAKGRHDPCVLPRTPPLLESMTALVLADAALIQRTRLGGSSTAIVSGGFEVDPIAAAKLNDANGPAAKKAKIDE
jgi:chorismate synthase